MDTQNWLVKLRQSAIVAVIHARNLLEAQAMAEAATRGGIEFIEISWNSADAAELLAILRASLPQCFVGVGTVLDMNSFEQAIGAGAQFVFMPYTNNGVIQVANRLQVPIIPGALTPTEIMAAWSAGATALKFTQRDRLVGQSTFLACARF